MIVLQCFSHFPIFIGLSFPPPLIRPQISPIFYPRFHSISKNDPRTGNRTTLRRSDSRNGSDPIPESAFFDENGVVEDMDGYLNYLSLEYDSVWDTKPSWCQPWTIVLTGVAIVIGSWLVLNSIVVTSVVATIICLWWYLFLYSYPKAYSDMIEERRKKVTSGLEDTYGMKTGQ